MIDLLVAVSQSSRALGALFCCWAAAMGLFIYNSGYGYDALEIMVVAQSLADGFRFYDLAPAKPCGIYCLLHVLLHCGVPLTHLTVTVVIVALTALPLAAAWFFARRFSGPVEALAVAGLIAIEAVFMEMNFLGAEGPVVFCGFMAALFLVPFVGQGRAWYVVAAGMILGTGFHFKQSAAFYSAGMFVWIVTFARPWRLGLGGAAWFAAGHLVPLSLVAAYFAGTGRWAPYIEWTFLFPLTAFPASSEYVDRMYTKLGWFTALILVTAVAAVLRPRAAQAALAKPACSLMLTAGTLALYPLLKSQAPHYFFPAAAFYAVVIVAIWSRLIQSVNLGRVLAVRQIALALIVFGAVAGSVVAYRPEAIYRILKLADYSSEEKAGFHLREMVPPDRNVLILRQDSLGLYFFGRRYPNIPTFHMDVQAAYYYRTRPWALCEAVLDPRLAAVIFDPDEPARFRIDQLPEAERKAFWESFTYCLQDRFRKIDDPLLGSSVWLRK
jgi:hypothetical protein